MIAAERAIFPSNSVKLSESGPESTGASGRGEVRQ